MSIGVGLGLGAPSGNFAEPSLLNRPWKEVFIPRKIEVTGWLKDWTLRDPTGICEEKMKEMLHELQNGAPQEFRESLTGNSEDGRVRLCLTCVLLGL